MLRDGETDIAYEGIVKDIVAGNQVKLYRFMWITLNMGYSRGSQFKYKTVSDLEDTKVAISRQGSGSQLMAYVNADNHGWKTDNLQFEIVNTIDGAVEALNNGRADYFMWERFMTKPLVDKGIFRRMGIVLLLGLVS
jgi:ABC-type amino acid transport substrate-binding protein